MSTFRIISFSVNQFLNVIVKLPRKNFCSGALPPIAEQRYTLILIQQIKYHINRSFFYFLTRFNISFTIQYT